MPITDAFDDEEVKAFVEDLPNHMTYSDMSNACIERFGQKRGWSRSKIILYLDHTFPMGTVRQSRLDADHEVRDFVSDRFGRVSLSKLREQCIERFGKDRALSKSSLHRFWKREQRRRLST